jgi:hypothetical protein
MAILARVVLLKTRRLLNSFFLAYLGMIIPKTGIIIPRNENASELIDNI